jgi:hypothetical protein
VLKAHVTWSAHRPAVQRAHQAEAEERARAAAVASCEQSVACFPPDFRTTSLSPSSAQKVANPSISIKDRLFTAPLPPVSDVARLCYPSSSHRHYHTRLFVFFIPITRPASASQPDPHPSTTRTRLVHIDAIHNHTPTSARYNIILILERAVAETSSRKEV